MPKDQPNNTKENNMTRTILVIIAAIMINGCVGTQTKIKFCEEVMIQEDGSSVCGSEEEV